MTPTLAVTINEVIDGVTNALNSVRPIADQHAADDYVAEIVSRKFGEIQAQLGMLGALLDLHPEAKSAVDLPDDVRLFMRL